MEINFKNRDYHNDNYDQLLGGDLFSQAVNEKMASYWVKTGHELNPQFAMIEVLAELYNDLKSNSSPTPNNGV